MTLEPKLKPVNISTTIASIEARSDLSRADAEALMEELLSGRMVQADVVRFLLAMRAKGETVEELVGFALVMRRHATPVPLPANGTSIDEWPLVDTCGTGGGAGGTFNVSTAAALVVAGAGVRVAKHGNRSISTRCGSADVLEALGVNLDLPPERIGEAIATIGIGFLFAPAMHTAMKHAMPARREVGGRTIFNLLGPLTNPAGAAAQLVGEIGRAHV
jgi:anthranilate phosphoribosyltransferase